MDRTREFQALCGQMAPSTAAPEPPPEPSAAASLVDFHGAAASISRDIHATSQRLAKLTQLVQKGSLFNDRSAEIEGLMHDVNGDIRALNGQLDSAREFVEWKKRQLGEGESARSRVFL